MDGRLAAEACALKLLLRNVSHRSLIGGVFVALPVASVLCLYWQIGLLSFTLVISLLSWLGWKLVQRTVGKPLDEMAARMALLKSGDLTHASHGDAAAAITAAATDVDEHATELAKKVDNALIAVSSTLTDLDSLRLAADKTARNAEHQSSHIAEVAATSEELSFSTVDIAQSAAEAAEIARSTKEAAVKGSVLADSASHNVQQVAQFAQELNTTVDRLNRKVSEIGEIITVVKDIADQTKLLALNASIEAARDGSHSGGFSVVAAEVRRLAERTVRETVQISARIRSVQEESERTTRSMQKTSSHVNEIHRNVKDVFDTLSSIVEISTKSQERIAQIAEAVDLQSRAMNRISSTMDQSSRISTGIFHMAGNVNTQVDAIVSTIARLRSSFMDYITNDRDRLLVELAVADHRLWSKRLAAHLHGEAVLARRLLPDHRSCQLGVWYYNELSKRFAHTPQYVEAEAQHLLIHSLASEVITLTEEGRTADAAGKLVAMDTVTQKLVHLLEALLVVRLDATPANTSLRAENPGNGQ